MLILYLETSWEVGATEEFSSFTEFELYCLSMALLMYFSTVVSLALEECMDILIMSYKSAFFSISATLESVVLSYLFNIPKCSLTNNY